MEGVENYEGGFRPFVNERDGLGKLILGGEKPP